MKKAISNYIIISLILILSLAVLVKSEKSNVFASGQGEIRVENNSNVNLDISISGSYQGKLEAGQSDYYKVPLGEHRCVGEWDKGYVYKYITLTESSPRGDWTITQGDIE